VQVDGYDTIEMPDELVGAITDAVAAMNAAGGGLPIAGIFDSAASKVVAKMARTMYPSFLQSRQCAAMLAATAPVAPKPFAARRADQPPAERGLGTAVAPNAAAAAADATTDAYYYPDETRPGEWQGPFKKEQLDAWFEHEHFDAHEVVRHGLYGANLTFGQLCRPDLHGAPGSAAAAPAGAGTDPLPPHHTDPSHEQWIKGAEEIELEHNPHVAASIRRCESGADECDRASRRPPSRASSSQRF
jgi:hypothetical protein